MREYQRNVTRRVIVNRFQSGAPGEVVAVWFPGNPSIKLTIRMARIVLGALLDKRVEVRALWKDTWGREQKIDERIKRGVEV